MDESRDKELFVLPRHTKVIVTRNNRTKSVLVGLQGVVKKAVGLGGWHWLNGVEVKIQRNALSVLEAPTGNEEEEDDDDMDCDNSFCSSSDVGDKDMDYSSVEFQIPTKPRVRHTRPWTSSARSNGRSRDGQFHSHKPQLMVNLVKLETVTLSRYWKHFNLVSINPNPLKEQLVHLVQHYFVSQVTRPVAFPYFGVLKKEKHVLLPSVADVVIEQGYYNLFLGYILSELRMLV